MSTYPRKAIRTLSILLTIGVIAAPVLVPAANAQDEMAEGDTLLTAEGWDAFGDNIAQAIYRGNAGESQAALRHIVQYGSHLNLDRELAFAVMRIYREGDDDQLRRLAVLALGNMNDKWAIEFLDMLAPFEESETLQKTMNGVVAAYRANQD